MLHSLDIFTLGICSILASSAFGTVFIALWTRRRSERHLLHWAASSWLYAIVLLGLYSPAARSIAVSAFLFALMGLTDVLVVSGVHRLDGERPFRRWMIVPPLATMTGHTLPLLLGADPDAPWGDVSIALGLGVAMGLCGAALLIDRSGQSRSRGRRIAGFALLAYLPGYIAVIVIRLWFPQSSALLPRIPMLSDQLLLGILNLGLLAIPAERAHERLRRAASRDPLTGAWNRDGLARFGADLLRPGGAVIAIDIDHFKAINDGHGHSAGDRVLIAVAKASKALIGESGGAVFRIGGDEFIAIVPACSATEALRLADCLRERGELARGLPEWTLSIGIALVTNGLPSVEEAINRADAALYRAKAAGRDRAEFAAA